MREKQLSQGPYPNVILPPVSSIMSPVWLQEDRRPAWLPHWPPRTGSQQVLRLLTDGTTNGSLSSELHAFGKEVLGTVERRFSGHGPARGVGEWLEKGCAC